MSGMWGVGLGPCLPVCCGVVRMSGVLSVSVSSSVLGRPLSASEADKTRLRLRFGQPASDSKKQPSAVQQSNAAKLWQRRDQRPAAATQAACARKRALVLVVEAGDGPSSWTTKLGQWAIDATTYCFPAQSARCLASTTRRYVQSVSMTSLMCWHASAGRGARTRLGPTTVAVFAAGGIGTCQHGHPKVSGLQILPARPLHAWRQLLVRPR